MAYLKKLQIELLSILYKLVQIAKIHLNSTTQNYTNDLVSKVVLIQFSYVKKLKVKKRKKLFQWDMGK